MTISSCSWRSRAARLARMKPQPPATTTFFTALLDLCGIGGRSRPAGAALVVLRPEGRARDLGPVAARSVLLRYLGDLAQQPVLERSRLEAHVDEAAVLDVQVVLVVLVARIGQELDLGAGQPGDERGQL